MPRMVISNWAGETVRVIDFDTDDDAYDVFEAAARMGLIPGVDGGLPLNALRTELYQYGYRITNTPEA